MFFYLQRSTQQACRKKLEPRHLLARRDLFPTMDTPAYAELSLFFYASSDIPRPEKIISQDPYSSYSLRYSYSSLKRSSVLPERSRPIKRRAEGISRSKPRISPI